MTIERESDGRALLSVRSLTTEIAGAEGVVRVVNGIDFDVRRGETVGIVGESGSGKSITMLSLLGLLPSNGRVVAGSAHLGGQDLLTLGARDMRRVLGKRVGLIFQDPMTSLNPLMTVSQQIEESLKAHSPQFDRRGRKRRVIELLDMVRIPRAAERARQYPHEFSGGMRQRVMIAMAMANGPELLLADEPTTALDVTVQAQVLDLIHDLQVETGMAVVLITHDLGVIAEAADRAEVMYAGRIVESGTVSELLHTSRHPYTVGLIASRPTLAIDRATTLPAIPGHPPNPAALPVGCAFRARCFLSNGREECRVQPPLAPYEDDHRAACHFSDELVTAPTAAEGGKR
jgi:peptide/nickel transport system ATP-binding protein/oligopeptide transport system ATP-binding protein